MAGNDSRLAVASLWYKSYVEISCRAKLWNLLWNLAISTLEFSPTLIAHNHNQTDPTTKPKITETAAAHHDV